jgi:hypothetical protein
MIALVGALIAVAAVCDVPRADKSRLVPFKPSRTTAYWMRGG